MSTISEHQLCFDYDECDIQQYGNLSPDGEYIFESFEISKVFDTFIDQYIDWVNTEHDYQNSFVQYYRWALEWSACYKKFKWFDDWSWYQ